MQAIGFKIYYADGSTFSSKQGKWEDAPSENVQFVLVYIADGLTLVHSRFDFYWHDGEVYGRSSYAFGDPPDLPEGAIKKGSTISQEEFKEMERRVQKDRDWGRA